MELNQTIPDRILQEIAENFLKLHEMDYLTFVGADAKRTKIRNKRNKPRLVPLTEDVVTLHKYLNNEASQCKNKLDVASSSEKKQVYKILNEVTLAQCILLSRRRCRCEMQNQDYEAGLKRKEMRTDLERQERPRVKSPLVPHRNRRKGDAQCSRSSDPFNEREHRSTYKGSTQEGVLPRFFCIGAVCDVTILTRSNFYNVEAMRGKSNIEE